MAGGRQRRQRRRKRRRAAAPPHIFSLGDDLVLEIFLRLPSLATLVRAALTCRAWRQAVASSASFRRRFRALHRAPLLGLFANPQGDALPLFAPAHCRDRDVLAAIRGGDFFFTSLQELDCNVPLRLYITRCRDGYVLITKWDAGLLAAVNPLDRQSPEYISLPNEDIMTGDRGQLDLLDRLDDVQLLCSDSDEDSMTGDRGQLNLLDRLKDVYLLCSDEDPMSFRLVWLFYDESRVRAAVFSSETWDWLALPWFVVTARTPPHDGDELSWLESGTQANGHIYWPFMNMEHLLTLDTETMEFAVSKLPPCLKNEDVYDVMVGETKDNTPCVVYHLPDQFCISVLLPGVDDDGLETWLPHDWFDYYLEYYLPLGKSPARGGMMNIVWT